MDWFKPRKPTRINFDLKKADMNQPVKTTEHIFLSSVPLNIGNLTVYFLVPIEFD